MVVSAKNAAFDERMFLVDRGSSSRLSVRRVLLRGQVEVLQDVEVLRSFVMRAVVGRQKLSGECFGPWLAVTSEFCYLPGA